MANSKHIGSLVCYMFGIDAKVAIEVAQTVLNRYAVPTHFLNVQQPFAEIAILTEPQTVNALETILQRSKSSGPMDPIVEIVIDLYVQLLKLDYLPGPDAKANKKQDDQLTEFQQAAVLVPELVRSWLA